MLGTLTQATRAADLNILLDNISKDQGMVYAAIFKGDEDFKKYKAWSGQKVKAQSSKMTLTFSNLEPGEYAVRIFHDENGNGNLDLGNYGIPTEGYAFSNEATVKYGPPTFEAMKVVVKQGKTPATTKAHMTYYIKK